MDLTGAFYESYKNFKNYPQNLILEQHFSHSNGPYRKTIVEDISHVLAEEDRSTEVKVRDIDHRSGLLEDSIVSSDSGLKIHIGDTSGVSGEDNGVVPGVHVATKRDPRCRLLFLSAPDSRSRIRITQNSLKRLMSYHQIMPQYLELLLAFGDQQRTPDPSIGGFRGLARIDDPIAGLKMRALGRSGRHLQVSCTLRAIAYISHDQSWSMRAAAIYHRFDLEEGTALWIIASGASSKLYKQIQEATGSSRGSKDLDFSSPSLSFKACLNIHLLNAFWALDQWTNYMGNLSQQKYTSNLTELVRQTTLPALEDRREQANRREFLQDDARRAHNVLETIQDAIIAIEGNIKVLKKLTKFYESTTQHQGFPAQNMSSSVLGTFTYQMTEIISDFEDRLDKAKYLAKTVEDRKILILQFVQSQAAEKMEHLSLEARSIAVDSRHEAVIVRIITVITLIYLPGTFVSTFFSTDVIKYQGAPGGGDFSSSAMWSWLYVTLPLTLVTVLVAGYFLWRSWRVSKSQKNKVPKRTMTLKEV